jgi:hypothetical protein
MTVMPTEIDVLLERQHKVDFAMVSTARSDKLTMVHFMEVDETTEFHALTSPRMVKCTNN